MNKLYILLFLLLASLPATAKYKGKVRAIPVQLEQKGDSLYVRIDFEIVDVSIDSRRWIGFTPVLKASGVEKTMPTIVIKGRADYLISGRTIALMSKAERRRYEKTAPYAVAKGYGSDTKRPIRYSQVLPFAPWMKEAQLDIRETLGGCGSSPRLLAVSQLFGRVDLEQNIMPYTVTPQLAYIQPVAEAVKYRELVGEAFLDFVVSTTDIRPDYMNNPRELKKITDMMEEVRNDDAVKVRSIYVIGYASPEGALAFNQQLSEGRAKALVDYLSPRFNFPRTMYHVQFGGENWAGLEEIVSKSDIEYKAEILGILRNTPTDTERKKSLMQLRGGAPYRYMLQEYYPSLRKAICKLNYEVRGFNAQEAKALIGTRPQNLSLNEMYMVANLYEPGTAEFCEVFETAVRLFPSDAAANVNAAAAALSRGDTPAAERYLKRVTGQTPQSDNAWGVLCLLRDNYRQAEAYLSKAAAAGLPEARTNLEELARKRENAELLSQQKN